MFALSLSKPLLSLTPAFVSNIVPCSGESLRGHRSKMTRVLVQSAAEFLEHLDSLSIAGCGRFCAQLTDPVLESAARHHVYASGNAYMWVDCYPSDSRTSSQAEWTIL